MPLTSGRYTLGPGDGSVVIRTGREGAAARMGHDLTLEATRWRATITVDVDEPSNSRASASVDAASLVVRDASGGPTGLNASQRAEIEAIVRTKVLDADRHPRITFRSTAVHDEGRRAFIVGRLSLAGSTRPIRLDLRLAPSRTPRMVATALVAQSEFGIEPYSALLGALRVKDQVAVTIEVRLSGG